MQSKDVNIYLAVFIEPSCGADFERLSFQGLHIVALNVGRYSRKSVACKEWGGKWKTNDNVRIARRVCEECFSDVIISQVT